MLANISRINSTDTVPLALGLFILPVSSLTLPDIPLMKVMNHDYGIENNRLKWQAVVTLASTATRGYYAQRHKLSASTRCEDYSILVGSRII